MGHTLLDYLLQELVRLSEKLTKSEIDIHESIQKHINCFKY